MKDAVGNELKVGDLVAIQLERPLVFGRLVEAAEGGLVTGVNHKGGAEVRPGHLVIESRHSLVFDPRQPVGAVLALREDAAAVGVDSSQSGAGATPASNLN